MKILVLCAAGASSTFVAQRIRKAAAAAGLDWHADASAWEYDIPADTNVVLLGPHLADRRAELSARIAVPVVSLPQDIFADFDGNRALRIIRDAIDAPSGVTAAETVAAVTTHEKETRS